jgi:hypothetical protein
MTKKEAVRVVEKSIHLHPEIRVIRRKEAVIEAKGSARYASVDGHHYCPECSTWTPGEPPAIKALGKEWKKVFNREVEKVWKTKSATQ